MAQTALSTPQLNIPGAFAHAEICSKTKSLVGELIKKDADNYHIFINEKGFHNHLVHLLLADFSLGADENRLKEIYDNEASSLRPKLPEKSDFKWDSAHCLGNDQYYTSYLHFFLSEIEKKGPIPCIVEYIFNDRTAEMYSRFLVGAYHPIIHTGYGVEFGIPMMVAEGLAQTAVHKAMLTNVFGMEPLKGKAQCPSGKHMTALELVQATTTDKRFDGVVKFNVNGKMKELASKVPEVLLEYLDKWPVLEQLDGPEGLRARAIELQALGAVMCCGTQPADKQLRLDFFLMHILTSSLFLHSFIENLNPVHGASLLRGKFLADLTLYVSFNRAAINMDQFKMYPKKPWNDIIKASIANNDEHLAKAVRAVKHAMAYDKSIDAETYHAMAQMILDCDAKWSMKEIGFAEAWEDIPARDVPNKQ